MKKNTYTAVYATFAETDAAVTLLQNAGFDMKRLSVAGTDYGTEMHAAGCYDTGNSFRFSGKSGDLWTKLSTTLSGWGTFWTSASGLVLVLGPLVQAIVAGEADNNPVTSTNEFGAGLSVIGIPRDSIVHYEKALMNDRFLLLVDGAADEIERAYQTLIETNPINGTLHHGIG